MAKILLSDRILGTTPFRGVILQGPMGQCANLGVIENAMRPSMENFHLDCPGGITYRSFGDGEILQKNWFWFGWDYGLQDGPLVDAQGTERTLEDIEHDLMDAAIQLRKKIQSLSAS